jgi:hypothetical protein
MTYQINFKYGNTHIIENIQKIEEYKDCLIINKVDCSMIIYRMCDIKSYRRI